MQPTGDGPKVYWYGPVDKIGSNLAALPRVLFITPTSVLICQPTGGVTRTVLVEKLAEVVLAPPTVLRLIVAQEPDLVVSTQSPSDRAELMSALMRSFRETCGEGSELPITESHHLILPNASPSPISVASHPPTPVNQRGTTGGWTAGDDHNLNDSSYSRRSPQQQQRSNDTPGGSIRGILGRLEDDSAPSAPSEGPSKPSFLDSLSVPTARQQRPFNGAAHASSGHASPSRIELSYDNHQQHHAPSSLASLQQQIEAQKRIIEKLQQDNVSDMTASNLRRELEQARALITDLQVALRSQEGAFSEMVKSSEALKTSETIRSSQDAQIHALRDELQSTKSELQRRELGDDEWRKKIASLEEGHRNEIQAVRDAFAKYDEQVTSYVDQVKKEHDTTLRELLQQKDALLVKQGELVARVEQLENEKRNAQQQRNLATGSVWRPQSPGPSHQQQNDISSDELRTALLAKLNRYTSSNPQSGAALAHYQSNREVDEPTRTRNQTPTSRRHTSPLAGRTRDRSIL